MAGPQQQAANQQQTKRGAENEAHPAPVAKRMTQEPEEHKDIQDAEAVQPSLETNHEEVQGAINQEQAPPAGDEAHDESAPENLEQAAGKVTANKGEEIKPSDEALEEAVVASATINDDNQIQASEESMQNGTSVTKVVEEDANEPGKVVKEINTVTSTVAV